MSASVGDNEGEVDLHWDSVPKARSYEIECCKDPISPEGRIHIGASPRSQFTAVKLESAKKYWFRVAPVLTDGEGPWSDPVAKVTQ